MATYLLNFKKQFAPAVEDGSKLQTIRQHRKDGKRIQPGDTLKLYTGLRTRSTRLLRASQAVHVASVKLQLPSGQLILDGRLLDVAEKTDFARADGFASFSALVDFFCYQYQLETFEGYCVRWAALTTQQVLIDHRACGGGGCKKCKNTGTESTLASRPAFHQPNNRDAFEARREHCPCYEGISINEGVSQCTHADAKHGGEHCEFAACPVVDPGWT